VARANGDIILFVDDDIGFGHERVLEQMVEAVRAADVGVVGTSKLLPPDSNWLQRRIGVEVPRAVTPVLDGLTESNPPLDSYGFTLVATMCCLVRRECFNLVGGFNEDLVTGEDPDFFYRVRRAGFRLVVPANCWVVHAPPATLRVLLFKSFMYGMGHAHESRLEPGRGMNIVPLDRWWARVAVAVAPLAALPSALVSVELAPRFRIRPALRPIQALSRLATLYGYAWGYFSSRAH
jgi:glycosyltransferase involved in cell wall biosynthesis